MRCCAGGHTYLEVIKGPALAAGHGASARRGRVRRGAARADEKGLRTHHHRGVWQPSRFDENMPITTLAEERRPSFMQTMQSHHFLFYAGGSPVGADQRSDEGARSSPGEMQILVPLYCCLA